MYTNSSLLWRAYATFILLLIFILKTFPDHHQCHGDSGGPLVLENPKYAGTNLDIKQDIDDREKFIQVGIVSWGEDCADEIFPGGTFQKTNTKKKTEQNITQHNDCSFVMHHIESNQ